MHISIDIEKEEPVFSQLIDQVKRAVQQGFVAPGDSLPSIRQLANDLDINNKTVAKAYQLLERDQILVKKGYRGTFVHPEAKSHCSVNIKDLASEQLSQVITSLRKAGVTDSEIRIEFNSLMNNK
jgi:GntR family transcriptional regulator